MAEPIPFEEQAEAIKLRPKPQPVTRINRKVVLAGVGLGVLALFFAASMALDPPTMRKEAASPELYNTTNQPRAEALAVLPKSYADAPPPLLGDPIPGDLGATIVQTERELGITPAIVQSEEIDFRTSPEIEAERAERIRLAKLAQESFEAPVFFQLQNGHTSLLGGNAPNLQLEGAGQGPFDVLLNGAGATRSAIAPRDPNFQDTKSAFSSSSADRPIYNPHGLEDPVSPFQVMAGTMIPASLVTGLNSDLPGAIIAQVTQPVYDTATGGHLLIPQGSKLIGRYDARVSFGQSRALIVWDRIIFPDASSILIEALPGTDQSGFAGLKDRVYNHFGRLFLAIGLATLLEVGSELSFNGDNGDIAEAIEESIQDTSNQAGQRIVDRNLNIQPTLKVRPGWPLRVIVTRDLVLRPYGAPAQ